MTMYPVTLFVYCVIIFIFGLFSLYLFMLSLVGCVVGNFLPIVLVTKGDSVRFCPSLSPLRNMSCELVVHFDVHIEIFYLRTPCAVRILVVAGNLN